MINFIDDERRLGGVPSKSFLTHTFLILKVRHPAVIRCLRFIVH